MERHRGVSPWGSAPFPGESVSQHLRNGALSVPFGPQLEDDGLTMRLPSWGRGWPGP